MGRKRVKLHTLGEKIKWLRQNKETHIVYRERDYFGKGYTQQEFADMLNVSVDTVKNWEQGYNYPTIDMLKEICTIFECDYDFLLGDQNTPTKFPGLSNSAAKALFDAYKSNNLQCKIVSDLLEQQDILRQIQKLKYAKYDNFISAITRDAFSNESYVVGKEDMFYSDLMRLYLLILSFINSGQPKIMELLQRMKYDDTPSEPI